MYGISEKMCTSCAKIVHIFKLCKIKRISKHIYCDTLVQLDYELMFKG